MSRGASTTILQLPRSLLYGVAPGKKLVPIVGMSILVVRGRFVRSAAIVGALHPALCVTVSPCHLNINIGVDLRSSSHSDS